MAKLSYESDQGKKFEILEDSHIFVKVAKGKEFFWQWESATVARAQLLQMLSQGEQDLHVLIELVKSHPFMSYGE
jgi:hypothetical protein